MSDRLPIVDNLCTNPENHAVHMCELKMAKNHKKIEELEKEPDPNVRNAQGFRPEGAILFEPRA